jgi:acyl-coenzyme A thioesterase PaaI-like protein
MQAGTIMDDDLEARIRSGKALSESMGDFHVTGWDPARRTLDAAFTVRREYCHTNGTIAQGGFITAWLDAAMAHAVIHDTDHAQTVFGLESRSLLRRSARRGPVEGRVYGGASGSRSSRLRCSMQLAAQATSTGSWRRCDMNALWRETIARRSRDRL